MPRPSADRRRARGHPSVARAARSRPAAGDGRPRRATPSPWCGATTPTPTASATLLDAAPAPELGAAAVGRRGGLRRRDPAARRPPLDLRQGRVRGAGGRARPRPRAGRPAPDRRLRPGRRRGAPAGPQPARRARSSILGGGGITESLLRLLGPFGCDVTVVRRRHEPMAGASGRRRRRASTTPSPAPTASCSPSPSRRRRPGSSTGAASRLLAPDAWLVNVARGGHIVTDDLVAALAEGAHRRRRARRHRPRAAARRPPAVDRAPLHHHAAHRQHARDGGAAAAGPGVARTCAAGSPARSWSGRSTPSPGTDRRPAGSVRAMDFRTHHRRRAGRRRRRQEGVVTRARAGRARPHRRGQRPRERVRGGRRRGRPAPRPPPSTSASPRARRSGRSPASRSA